jgi:hypothetical protein
MHFCSGLGCHQFYHLECLIKGNFIEPDDLKLSRPHSMVTCSPDTDHTFILPDLFNAITTHPHTLDRSTMHLEDDLNELLTGFDILTPLLNISQQPIVKGFGFTGVVGNVRPVVEARRMIYKALGDLTPIPDSWEEEMGGPASTSFTISCEGF